MGHINNPRCPYTRIVYKTAIQTVNNNNTSQNDTHLFFNMAANTTWLIEVFLLANSSAVADLKFSWTVPAGASGYQRVNNAAANALTSWLVDGTGDSRMYLYDQLVVFNGATAGNAQLLWAQSTAEVSDTSVLAGSFLRVTRLA